MRGSLAVPKSPLLCLRRPDGSSGRRMSAVVAAEVDALDVPRVRDLEPLQSSTDLDEDEDGVTSSVR